MGGGGIDDDQKFAAPSNEVRTVVLFGRTGNEKSATGNSIVGTKAFKSRACSSGVTPTCELNKTLLNDGRVVRVIDTPGLFDFSLEPEFARNEIVKCIRMAKDGIHAVLVVLSIRTRLSQEEKAAFRDLQTLFGRKIIDYMVVLFTGGDELEENDEPLKDYLGRDCPEPLKEILSLCKYRVVLFDNKTKDERKKAEQVEKLISLVDKVVEQNGGRPYSDELFVEFKKEEIKLHQQVEGDSCKGNSQGEISELKERVRSSYEEQQLKCMTEMVESKLRQTTSMLEQQLAEERAARLEAEKKVELAKEESRNEMQQLRHNLERAQKEIDENHRRAEEGKCNIL